MHDPQTFEGRLADAFERYLDAAPVQINAAELATAIARRAGPARSPWFGFLASDARPRWAMTVLVGLLTLALVVSGALLVGRFLVRETPPPALRGEFVPAGVMTVRRDTPVIVQLADGRVLIVGGSARLDLAPVPSAEIFDPSTGVSRPIADRAPGGTGKGLLLPDGRVLLVMYDSSATASTAHLFDPTDERFEQLEATAEPSGPPFGVEPRMALLSDGRVLVSGGLRNVFNIPTRDTALVFDPATASFEPTGSMRQSRWRHSMTTLADGRVLVAGGESLAMTYDSTFGFPVTDRRALVDGELYDPATGQFSPVALLHAIEGSNASWLLPDGRVLVMPVGSPSMGVGEGVPLRFLSGPVPVEAFDPASATFVSLGSLPSIAGTATVLPDGWVLLTGERFVAGATSGSGWEPWAAFFDPGTGERIEVADPAMRLGSAVLLDDGRVLVAGGLSPTDDAASDLIQILE